MDFSSLSNDYYLNVNLNTEMNLPSSRETILGFFRANSKNISQHAEFLHPRVW